jgi:hypothetical protein
MHLKERLRIICEPIQDYGHWRPRWNRESYSLYKDINIMDDIKMTRLGWMIHITRMEDKRILKKILNGKLHNRSSAGKLKKRLKVTQRDAFQTPGI